MRLAENSQKSIELTRVSRQSMHFAKNSQKSPKHTRKKQNCVLTSSSALLLSTFSNIPPCTNSSPWLVERKSPQLNRMLKWIANVSYTSITCYVCFSLGYSVHMWLHSKVEVFDFNLCFIFIFIRSIILSFAQHAEFRFIYPNTRGMNKRKPISIQIHRAWRRKLYVKKI